MLLQTTYPNCDGTPAVAAQPATPSSSPRCCVTPQVSLGLRTAELPERRTTRAFTHAVMHPLPTKQLKTMPNPCAGVPKNAWCSKRKKV